MITVFDEIKNSIVPQHRKRALKKNHTEYYESILSHYEWLDYNTSFNELHYVIQNKIEQRPTCNSCTNYVSWDTHNLEYHRYCSSSCSIEIAINKASQEEAKATRKKNLIEKYGVENIFQHKDIVKTIQEKKALAFIEKYGSTDDYKVLKNRFDWRVKYHTDKTYNKYRDIIDPLSLRGRHYHIDHIYSKYDAFHNEVPIAVLCHWSNLILVPYTKNLEKNKKSGKTIDELYNDYYHLPLSEYKYPKIMDDYDS